ncbi:MAG: hypothetical protein HYZ16_12220 [Bacteroidetes bacterium]|jgi:hypothetical protein|nr:hypothetical protein [Bacteroidota bacterium]
MELLAIYKKWFAKLILIPFSFLVFYFSAISVSASPIIFDQDHHTGTSEICTYDEAERLVWNGVGQTAGLSRVLSVKGVRQDREVLVAVASVAAKGVPKPTHVNQPLTLKPLTPKPLNPLP